MDKGQIEASGTVASYEEVERQDLITMRLNNCLAKLLPWGTRKRYSVRVSTREDVFAANN